MFTKKIIKKVGCLLNRGRENPRLWAPPGQFNSPIPDVEEVLQREEEIFKVRKKEVPGIRFNEQQQLFLLDRVLDHFASFQSFYLRDTLKDLRFKLNGKENIFFSYIDAVVLWGMMLYYKPSTIIEVGSGYSSALMLDYNEYVSTIPVDLSFIEPYPERLFSLLKEKDQESSRIIDCPLQSVGPETFSRLTENDILFVDSSHVSKTGSDVNHLFFSVLPALEKGVIVHFHDIFFPFEYKKEWVVEGRAWNEAYLCRAFLMYNNVFEMLFFNSFLEQFHSEYFERLYNLGFPRQDGASLWLRKS